jgi:NADH-quinone oxidoreductase subunit B
MIVAGRLAQMAPVVRQLYDQMPEPKWVISMGACATSNASSAATPSCKAVIKSSRRRAPGCPPRPEALLYSILQLQRKSTAKGSFKRALNIA